MSNKKKLEIDSEQTNLKKYVWLSVICHIVIFFLFGNIYRFNDIIKSKDETDLQFRLLEEPEQFVKRTEPPNPQPKEKKIEPPKIKIEEKKTEKFADKKSEKTVSAEEKISKTQNRIVVPDRNVNAREPEKSIDMFKKTGQEKIEKSEITKRLDEIEKSKEISVGKFKFSETEKKVFESSTSKKTETLNINDKRLERTAVSETLEKQYARIEAEKPVTSRAKNIETSLFEKKSDLFEKNDNITKTENVQQLEKFIKTPDKTRSFVVSQTRIKESEHSENQNDKFAVAQSNLEYSPSKENFSKQSLKTTPAPAANIKNSQSSNPNLSIFSKNRTNSKESGEINKTPAQEYSRANPKIQTSKSALISESSGNLKESSESNKTRETYSFSISSTPETLDFADNSKLTKQNYNLKVKKSEIKNINNSNAGNSEILKKTNYETAEKTALQISKKETAPTLRQTGGNTEHRKFDYESKIEQTVKETKSSGSKSNQTNIKIKDLAMNYDNRGIQSSSVSTNKTSNQIIQNANTIKEYNVKDEQINLFNKTSQLSEKKGSAGNAGGQGYKKNLDSGIQTASKYSIQKTGILSGAKSNEIKTSSPQTQTSSKSSIEIAKLPDDNSYNNSAAGNRSYAKSNAGASIASVKTGLNVSQTNSKANAAFSGSSKSTDNVPLDLSIPMPGKPGTKSSEPQKKTNFKTAKTEFSGNAISQGSPSVSVKTSAASNKPSNSDSGISVAKELDKIGNNKSGGTGLISGKKTNIASKLAPESTAGYNTGKSEVPSYKTSGGKSNTNLFAKKIENQNGEVPVSTSKNINIETQNKTAEAAANKINVSYNLKNASSKVLSDNVENQQGGAEGKVNVGLKLSYKNYKVNPEYLKLLEKKSQDALNLKLKKTFAGFKQKIIQSMEKQKLFGDIELNFEKNGQLKKIKYADGDVAKNKKLKQTFEEYLKASKLIIPVDIEALVVIKIEYEKNTESPSINYQFFW
ncbi:MAG TPA: hypothetical protein PKY81_02420 [bacterium]|nr:hypothetical protein [bacterium]HPN29790.1 hypothetical protein [bacterium]